MRLYLVSVTLNRFSAKIDGYSKKALSNDLVRERLFKDNKDFIALKDSDREEEGASVFTDEDFKRYGHGLCHQNISI